MFATMRIAEVADRSGFSTTTLRYYEQLGLLPAPSRTAAGYREFDETVLGRLAFIARAKALGCSLDEVAGLLPEWDGGRCRPVQDRLRELVTDKLGDARRRAAELRAFSADLERILADLGSHTPDGPCDSDCGCVTDLSPGPVDERPATPPVACTLDAGEMSGRVQAWRDLVAHVVDRTVIDRGTRLGLDAATPLDEVVGLMAAEQRCCSFFAFALTVDDRGPALEVRAPPEAKSMVDALFAEAAGPTPLSD